MTDKQATAERVSVVALDGDLEWLLMCGSAAMGERGTLAGVVNALEAGGGGQGKLDESGAYIHPITDLQVGFGSNVTGDVERHRWLMGAWRMLEQRTRNILALCYLAPRGQHRSDDGYGARDRWIKELDRQPGAEPIVRTGIEGHLGEYATLCFALTEKPGYLVVACCDPEPKHQTGVRKGQVNREEADRRRKYRRDALKVARDASVDAHREWAEMKALAMPVRDNQDRRARLPAYVPAEASEFDEAAKTVRAVVVPLDEARLPRVAFTDVVVPDERRPLDADDEGDAYDEILDAVHGGAAAQWD